MSSCFPVTPASHSTSIFFQVQEHQKLMVDFPEYPNVLIRMLNSCIKEPHRLLGAYLMLIR
jgi:hypothetical protein